MLFSRYGALFGLLGGLVEASPAPIHRMGELVQRSDVTPARRSISPAVFDLGKEWQGETLFKGLASAPTDTAAGISLDVSLPEAAVAGSITVDVTDNFLIAPTVRVSLADVKAYVQLALGASAGVFESIELFASEKLSVEIPGLLEIDLGAAFALDLVIGVDAAVSVLAGFYVNFPADAYIEINLLTKEIVDTHLDGLVAQSLPIAVGAEVDLSAEIELSIGLRLRAGLELDADVDILGLDIGAGADVAIWVSLFDYTTVLVQTSDCPVSVSESFALDVGIAIELDVDVLDLLELNLAPSIAVTLATAPAATVCIPSLGGVGVPSSDPSSPQVGAGGDDSGDDSGSDAASSSAVSATDAVVSSVTSAAAQATSSGSWNDTGLITSTVTSTATYTITSCAASVHNCPASYTQKVVTVVTHVTTTVCPATQTSAGPTAYPTASTSSSCTVPTPTNPTSMSPCPTPSTSTVVIPTTCPTPVPTVTITDSTTICPATQTLATGSASGYPTGSESAYPTGSASGYPTGSVSESGAESGYPTGPATTYPGETKPSSTAEAPAPTYPASYPVVTPPASTYQPSASAPAPSAPCSTCMPVEAGVGRVAGGAMMAALPLLAALL